MESPFIIRAACEEDLDAIYRLSRMVYFINLPADRELLKEKIRHSIDSFAGGVEDKFAREYILVMESLEDGAVVGTSMVIARHGSPREPHMYFQLREIHKYSETIHGGIIHRVLRLRFDDDGPTEIGGLVLAPALRGHRDKLGRQLSYSRFMLIRSRRRSFKSHVLSELMPPLLESGESLLWEALGRRFTNLSYQEADALSRKNKEFVTSLFPKGDIYTCLLPGEVRDLIGRVGADTLPVKHMLEKIGFSWRDHIDPFDGGPHYAAETDKILPVRDTRKMKVGAEPLKRKNGHIGLVSPIEPEGFRCLQTPFALDRGKVLLPRLTLERLGLGANDSVYFLQIQPDPSPTRVN